MLLDEGVVVRTEGSNQHRIFELGDLEFDVTSDLGDASVVFSWNKDEGGHLMSAEDWQRWSEWRQSRPVCSPRKTPAVDGMSLTVSLICGGCVGWFLGHVFEALWVRTTGASTDVLGLAGSVLACAGVGWVHHRLAPEQEEGALNWEGWLATAVIASILGYALGAGFEFPDALGEFV